ncbi:MAG: type ISP restriction/modification enzyme [Bacteroidota bacterium]
MPDSPLVHYLRDVHLIHRMGAGTKEASFYPALSALFNALGRDLRPQVHCLTELANTGAGHPDLGFYTADQLAPDGGLKKSATTPTRGVGEVKAVDHDLAALTESEQVSKYWTRYRQVLVTNLRQFAFISEDAHGNPIILERLSLGDSPGAFWATAAHADRLAGTEHEAEALAFFERCLRHAAPVEAPKDLAWFLASYAKTARARLETAPPGVLASLRADLQDTLGVRYRGESGERFLRGTVVQTLFYGVFSAWTPWHKENPDRTDLFVWHSTPHYLRLPVLDRLFREVSGGTAKSLGLTDLLDRTARTLARVKRPIFFKRFQDAEAIQYFYEPFLEAYAPDLRKQFGVWYTPPELVRYMVATVDRALVHDLGIPDGLADPRVTVLDPACGTGAFLVETLRHIRQRLEAQGEGALLGDKLRRAATDRLYGFEVLTAPFVVAHLQIGLALAGVGAPMPEGKRAAIYLTNALTGWDKTKEDEGQTLPPEFAAEAEAARSVKRSDQILVVLGNPPYDGYAEVQITGENESELVAPYRESTGTDVPQPRGQGLNDLYVRFFRIAERQIAERTGRGIVCYVSNASYLDGLSHPALREHLLHAFDHVRIDNLNGDKYKTGKTTPEGDPDPSIFSTPSNREGIQVGTAVATLVRLGAEAGIPRTQTVQYRDFWGTAKLATLSALAEPDYSTRSLGVEGPEYVAMMPEPSLGLPFVPREAAQDYFNWPKLPDLFPASFPGVKTSRDGALVDIDRDALEARMTAYFDPAVTDADMASLAPELMRETKRFDGPSVRRGLTKRGMYEDGIRPYLYRPFDLRWLYWDPETKLLDEKRADYEKHVTQGNLWISAGQRERKGYLEPQFTTHLADHHIVEANCGMFPLYLAPDLGSSGGAVEENLTSTARTYLATLAPEQVPLPDTPSPLASRGGTAGAQRRQGGADQPSTQSPQEGATQPSTPPETGAPTAADLFHHTLAVLHAPAYRAENGGALRQDWPRVPLPTTRETLRQSAALGRRLAALLDPQADAPDARARYLRTVAPLHTADARPLDPDAGDLAVKVKWGVRYPSGAVNGTKGHSVSRPFSDAEKTVLSPDRADALGGHAVDVYLSERVLWRGIPAAVWTYALGGYPVLKKWLSYRAEPVLGRSLRSDEAETFTEIARRIAAVLLLDPELDAAYAAARAS